MYFLDDSPNRLGMEGLAAGADVVGRGLAGVRTDISEVVG